MDDDRPKDDLDATLQRSPPEGDQEQLALGSHGQGRPARGEADQKLPLDEERYAICPSSLSVALRSSAQALGENPRALHAQLLHPAM